MIANAKSGSGNGATVAQEAGRLCLEHGYELVDYPISSPEDFETQSEKAVAAADADGGVVIAAGGDGTLRGVAQAAHGRKVRFAAVPIGTFNFFARTHQIPETLEQALVLALTGRARPVRLGEVNGKIFLINASLGLYAKAIREREMRTARYGRNRLVVIISTLLSLLSRHSLLRVDVIRDGQPLGLWTPMIFVGNNALQLRDLALDVAKCMKQGLLAVVLMKSVTKLEALRIIFRGIFKTIANEEKLETFCIEEMSIHTRRSAHTIALDGELFQMQTPLRIKSLPDSLNLVLPPQGSDR